MHASVGSNLWSYSPTIAFSWLVELLLPSSHVNGRNVKPVVAVRNGTLVGGHNTRYHQEFLLGPWKVAKQASAYGFRCDSAPLSLPGYSHDGLHHEEDEDCLTLNIIRPSGATPSSRFPVLESIAMGTPTIGVSFSYQVSRVGLVSGRAFNDPSLANFVLYDQQTALYWIQENIAAFGGDPTRVTIQAESSGAFVRQIPSSSVRWTFLRCYHGAPLSSAALVPLDEQERMYQDVLIATGCTAPIEPIEGLRQAPRSFFPVMDGKFITDFPSNVLKQGKFVKVRLLIGSNLNEGTGYIASGMFGAVNTGAELRAVITGFGTGKYLTNDTIDRIVDGYLQLPIWQFRANLGTTGDYLVNAPKRYSTQMWAQSETPVYRYLFAAVPNGVSPRALGATHFQEAAFVLNNSEGVGFTVPPLRSSDSQMENQPQDGPNNHHCRLLCCFSQSGYSLYVMPYLKIQWPMYQKDSAANLVFRIEGPTVEPDTWRSGF
ncbi:Alpha/Beta hydrolase protein [Aspergillus pseudonomiae]|nr:Alpha/Beta hydrolase protein [Aspergillus pseudonomiae]